MVPIERLAAVLSATPGTPPKANSRMVGPSPGPPEVGIGDWHHNATKHDRHNVTCVIRVAYIVGIEGPCGPVGCLAV